MAQDSRFSPTFGVWVAALVVTVIAISVSIYVVPVLLDSNTFEAFDSFAYVSYINEDPQAAREAQRFLNIYPANAMPNLALNLYGSMLHLVLLAPLLVACTALKNRERLISAVVALLTSESLLFLGTASKEGLAVVAVFGCICAHFFLDEERHWGFVLSSLYAIGIAEISRPKFGVIFLVCMIISLIPYLSAVARLRILTIFSVAVLVGVWVVLKGPLAEPFAERYETGKTFLEWFEREMPSESSMKGAVRGFFSLAFASDEPSVFFIAIVFLLSVLKAIIYLFAIPLISPPEFSALPAQTWALAWQISTSFSTVFVFAALLRWKRLCVIDRSQAALLIFGSLLLYAIALSTFIFHVRYRAPVMVSMISVFLMLGVIKKRVVLGSSVFLLLYMILHTTLWVV